MRAGFVTGHLVDDLFRTPPDSNLSGISMISDHDRGINIHGESTNLSPARCPVASHRRRIFAELNRAARLAFSPLGASAMSFIRFLN
jgi:hypothetical protein